MKIGKVEHSIGIRRQFNSYYPLGESIFGFFFPFVVRVTTYTCNKIDIELPGNKGYCYITEFIKRNLK